MTEDDLLTINALIARFHRTNSPEDKFAIQLELLRLGVQPDNPLPAPDPRSPPGGTAIALRKAA